MELVKKGDRFSNQPEEPMLTHEFKADFSDRANDRTAPLYQVMMI